MTDLTLTTKLVLQALMESYQRERIAQMSDSLKTTKTLTLDELIIGSLEGPHVRIQSTTIEGCDRNGTRRFRLLTEGGRYPTLELFDGNGHARISAGVYDNGAPYIVFRDGGYVPRAELAMDEDLGEVSLIFCDRNETRVFSVGEDQEGSQIQRVDEHGNMVPWTPKAGRV